MSDHPQGLTHAAASSPWPLVRRTAAAIVLVMAVKSLQPYADYLPPDFSSDFLMGRQRYFHGAYRWAFYPHIAAGPVTLVLGTLLVSDMFRQRFPGWHRRLGRVQGLIVLSVLVPSGLWMAPHAAGGPVAAVGLAALAVATATCMLLGWRAAVSRRFHDHARWMLRTYLLLCSAVVLRIAGTLATALGVTSLWYEPLAVWASWLGPLAVHECAIRLRPSAGLVIRSRYRGTVRRLPS